MRFRWVLAALFAAIAFGALPSPAPRVAVAATDPDLTYFAGDNNADTAVSISGEDFLINGQSAYAGRTWNSHSVQGLLLNSRMVNGVYDDMDGNPPSGMVPWDPRGNTEDYIANMPAWRAQGLNAIDINLQGGSNRCNNIFGDNQIASVDNNPFGANGTKAFDDWNKNVDSPEARYLARMGSVIREADDLGMVVILGMFYFGQDDGLQDETAVIAAVDATTDWVLANGWTNVIIEINNEANINYDHAILQPNRVTELIQRVQQRSSAAGHRLLVSTSGGGGYKPPDAWVQDSDFVLLHGNSLNASGVRSLVDGVRNKSVWKGKPKPIVFNEDSTNLNNFQAAVEDHAGWGFYDDGGYQCVFDNNDTTRWTLGKTTESGYWPMVADISGVNGATNTAIPTPPHTGTPTPTLTPTPTPALTPAHTPEPTQTPTVTPAATASPLSTPGPTAQGNVDCVAGVNGNDVLAELGMLAGLGASQCAANADTNCNGALDGRDVLAILLYIVHAPALAAPTDCRTVGT